MWPYKKEEREKAYSKKKREIEKKSCIKKKRKEKRDIKPVCCSIIQF
jgi:hypothetical protein